MLDAEFYLQHLKDFCEFIYILEQTPDRFVENDPPPEIVETCSRDYALPVLFEWENEGQTPIANL